MKKSSILAASLVLCLLIGATNAAQATSSRRNQWRAYYPTAATDCPTLYALNCTMCHPSTADPVTYNSYGALLDANGADFAAADIADSDGDGRTNGEEIKFDCTKPYDITSPDEIDSWGMVKALYR